MLSKWELNVHNIFSNKYILNKSNFPVCVCDDHYWNSMLASSAPLGAPGLDGWMGLHCTGQACKLDRAGLKYWMIWCVCVAMRFRRNLYRSLNSCIARTHFARRNLIRKRYACGSRAATILKFFFELFPWRKKNEQTMPQALIWSGRRVRTQVIGEYRNSNLIKLGHPNAQ